VGPSWRLLSCRACLAPRLVRVVASPHHSVITALTAFTTALTVLTYSSLGSSRALRRRVLLRTFELRGLSFGPVRVVTVVCELHTCLTCPVGRFSRIGDIGIEWLVGWGRWL
jgi:hypothetical protein